MPSYDTKNLRIYHSKRAIRGGSAWNNAQICRSAYRNANERGNRTENLGFRLAAAHLDRCISPADPILSALARSVDEQGRGAQLPCGLVGRVDARVERLQGSAFFITT